MSSDDARFYRRKLPHWRLAGAVYFVTWRLVANAPPLTVLERSLLADVLSRFADKRYELFAYVIMDDHAHVLVRPHVDHALESLMHSWKSYSARLLQREGRRGPIWQREYFDRIVRNEHERDEKVQYILNNPARRWPGVTEYPWVWCRPDLRE